jgi:hypothetical protein
MASRLVPNASGVGTSNGESHNVELHEGHRLDATVVATGYDGPEVLEVRFW